MPNGKPGDNPLTDLLVHGRHPFPPDIEELLLRIEALGRAPDRWPLGENWPYSPREFDWARGEDLATARRVLKHLVVMLDAGRGDEVLVDPRTRRAFGTDPRHEGAAIGRIRVIDADLLDQQVDVIVNAWNRNIIPWWLLLPQGVSGAIKRKAGWKPFRELGWRPMPLGSARHTSAGRLPYKGIIHVAGIDMLWRASAESVAASVASAVSLALQHGYRSIAFPIIGAGSGGLSEEAALETMTTELERLAPDLEITLVRFHR